MKAMQCIKLLVLFVITFHLQSVSILASNVVFVLMVLYVVSILFRKWVKSYD